MMNSKILIWLLIITDLLSGLLQVLQWPFYRLGLVLKGVIILVLFLTFLRNVRQKTIASVYITIFILFLTWLIGFSISCFNNPDFDYIDSIVVLNRYFFFLILLCPFSYWSSKESFTDECKRILEYFFILNNISIFIGFVFGIDILSTYDPFSEYGDNWRFGYKGLIFGQNAVAAIYTLGLAFVFRENFKYGRKKTFLLYSTCIAVALVGTKATWLALVLIPSYYLFAYRVKALIFIITPAIIGLIYIAAMYWAAIKEKYFIFVIDKYNTMDFYTFWTSNRNSLLVSSIERMKSDWILVNFFTGDASSYVEMDFFDLYFYFGVGAIIYLFIYTRIFFIRDTSNDNRFFFTIWMMLAFIAGHVINSAIVPLFFLLYIYSSNNLNQGRIEGR